MTEAEAIAAYRAATEKSRLARQEAKRLWDVAHAASDAADAAYREEREARERMLAVIEGRDAAQPSAVVVAEPARDPAHHARLDVGGRLVGRNCEGGHHYDADQSGN